MKFKNSCRYILILSCLIFFSSGCNKTEEEAPALETGSVTDADGNVYKTVKIGDQWWMTENLKVKSYRNGIPIPEVSNSDAWANRSAGAYCIYDNGNSASLPSGLLYNWYAVNDTGNIAPVGWHIPTDAEWKTLEQHLGMSPAESDKLGWRGSNEGDKLKIEGHTGWSAYGDVWATNESGFTALAGSCRLPNADFGQPGLFATGFWWSRSEFQNTEAWYRYLDYKNSNVFRSHESKTYGFSVRCVKD